MPNQLMSKLLADAIMNTAITNVQEAIKEIKMYMKNGADPSEALSIKQSDREFTVTPFTCALQLNNYKIFSALLTNAKEQNILIKLDAPFNFGKKSAVHRNVFQQACVSNDLEIVNLLIEYGLETGQDMYKICNKSIPLDTVGDDTSVACLSDLMSTTITGLSLTASPAISKSVHGSKSGDDVISGLRKWRNFSTTTAPDAEAPALPDVIKIFATGRSDVLASLIKHKLIDPEITSLDMHPMHLTLKSLSSYKSVEDFMDDVVPTINAFSKAKLKQEDISMHPTEPGVFLLQMSISNPNNEFKQKFEVVFDLREAADLVEKYAAEFKAGSRVRVESIEKLKKRLDRAEETLSDVPSVRLKTLRDEFENHASTLKCLNTIHAKTLNTLTAFNIASTGMIGTKPTEKSAQVAKIAQAAFSAVANSVNVPGVALLPAITKWVLDTSILTNERNKAKGVVRATTDLDVNALAVDVAALVAAEVNMSGCRDDGKLADQLAAHVVEQIKLLKNFPEGTFNSAEEVVGFLASKSIAQIQANVDKHRTSSDKDSQSTPTHSDHGKGFGAEDQSPVKRKQSKGGTCSIS